MPVDNVINQLEHIDVPDMQDSLHLRRTGAFQSRTVEVGGEECSIQELITSLGEKIKNADVTKDEPNLEKLKAMLTSVSAVEREDRSITSSLYHLFTRRDKDFVDIDHMADVKIKQHDAFKALLGGVSVPLKVSPFPNLLRGLYSNANEIGDDVRLSRPIYLKEKGFSWADNGTLKIQFYMQPEDILGSQPKYKLAVMDPNVKIQDVIDHLAKMDIKEEI